jgi:16S rRNA (cytosine1402-N4)-methyltransferase
MVACRMKKIFNEHQSVLLDEVIENLIVDSDGVYIDATFGRGGHASVILERLGPKGQLIAVDKDLEAISYAKDHFSHDSRFSIHHGSFADLSRVANRFDVNGNISGILFDLGVSSPQLDDPDRGFSFMREGKLDMRMDHSQGTDAATWIAKTDEKEIARVLFEYGEERFSRRIAKAIVLTRQTLPITTTTQLAEIIAKAHPAWQKGKHPATRSFQAIRIALNRELEDLEIGLRQAVDVLKIKGRLLVISFHSLEDRMVKHFMQKEECGADIPSDLPIKHCHLESKFKRLGRAIKPCEIEIATNPRARSAILRIGEKLL